MFEVLRVTFEAGDPQQALFGDERLHACFADGAAATATETVDRLLQQVRAFAAGAPQSDDITILALRRTAGLERLNGDRL